MPSHLDFGFVPCKETVKLPLAVRNTGDLRVTASWKMEAPFVVEPHAATVEPGQVHTFTVSFTPHEACAYTVNALCTLDSGDSTTVGVSACWPGSMTSPRPAHSRQPAAQHGNR